MTRRRKIPAPSSRQRSLSTRPDRSAHFSALLPPRAVFSRATPGRNEKAGDHDQEASSIHRRQAALPRRSRRDRGGHVHPPAPRRGRGSSTPTHRRHPSTRGIGARRAERLSELVVSYHTRPGLPPLSPPSIGRPGS